MRREGHAPVPVSPVRRCPIENVGGIAAAGFVEADRSQMPRVELRLRIPVRPCAGDGYDREGVEHTLGAPAAVAVVRPLEADADVAEQVRLLRDLGQLAQPG